MTLDGKIRNMTAIYLFRGERVLLLLRQGGNVADGLWTGSAGGHFEVEDGIDARRCVLRELQEETGIRECDLEGLSFRYLTVRRMPDEIRQVCYFFAGLKETAGEEFSSAEGRLQWFDLDAIGDLEMPYTAKYVMEHFRAVGRNSEALYLGIAQKGGVKFEELPKI